MELGRLGSGITINSIRAGVTKTPALMKIPEHEMIIASAMARNPTGRMTTTQDVANAIVALSGEGTGFISGEIIGVDGGEFITGPGPGACPPRSARSMPTGRATT